MTIKAIILGIAVLGVAIISLGIVAGVVLLVANKRRDN